MPSVELWLFLSKSRKQWSLLLRKTHLELGCNRPKYGTEPPSRGPLIIQPPSITGDSAIALGPLRTTRYSNILFRNGQCSISRSVSVFFFFFLSLPLHLSFSLRALVTEPRFSRPRDSPWCSGYVSPSSSGSSFSEQSSVSSFVMCERETCYARAMSVTSENIYVDEKKTYRCFFEADTLCSRC